MKQSKVVVKLLTGLLLSSNLYAAENKLTDFHITQIAGGLLLVLMIIFWGAWLAKRLRFGLTSSNNQLIKILAYLPMGTRDKIILIQVGEEQLLVSSGAQGIQKLHQIQTPIEIKDTDSFEKKGFQGILKKILNNDSHSNQDKS